MGDWTEEIRREERIYPPVHPGEILHMEFLEPMGTWPRQARRGLRRARAAHLQPPGARGGNNDRP
jgi:hypothetical protein